MSRRVARLIPFYEFDINDFFGSDGAPAAVATQRQDGFFRLAGIYQERFARSRQMTAQAATQISDLQFTEDLPGSVSVQPAGPGASRRRRVCAILGWRHRHRSRRQRLLRPDRLLRRQYLRQRLLQGMYREGRDAGPCARPGARTLPSRHRRQCRAAVPDFGARRSLVPHVRHRSGDAGGEACPLSHPPFASGSLCRGLSWLVGRRAARRRQSAVAARNLYPGRDVGTDAACAANPQRHRLRSGQSAAGAAPQRQRAGGFGAGRQLAKSPFRPRGLQPMAEIAAGGLHRAQYRV